ncbi:MAG: hypothetical protein A2X49_00570 [Lentisphaerae bacterium GWF2_52_8]|nr:MAG: hypothetical protein A2X49_00570 [Lentisphaerae bacterium GWF2_52_8]
MAKARILHITPHMGGGVGKVIAGLAARDPGLHSVVLLEEPVNHQFIESSQAADTQIIVQPEEQILAEMMARAEMVILHWWHNPNMARLLAHFPSPEVRLVIWSHISNLTVPALNPEFILRANMLWFASPASFEAEVFSKVPQELLRERCAVVYGSGLDASAAIPRTLHEGFNIGYIGLLDFSKLHPDYLSFCKSVDLPGVRFIMAGDGAVRELIEKQVHSALPGIPFEFPGYVKDVPALLSRLDVFGYPIMPQHTCATENAIFEAMAAQVPPVLLRQLTEKYVVKDGDTGILVSGPKEYGEAMRYLFEHPRERLEMGERARRHVLETYSLYKVGSMFESAVEKTMKTPKKRTEFRSFMGETPAEWFISCLGRDKERFQRSFEAGLTGQTPEIRENLLSCSPLMKMEKKASAIQYAELFPDDPMLAFWGKLLRYDLNSSGIPGGQAVL